MTYRVGLIGTGAKRGGTSESGFAMGYRHGNAYADLEECELVACADVVEEHAERFAAEFGFDAANAYRDHREMLAEVDLDVVGIATPITTHADIVVDCATVGDPLAIHCEKPMADTWGDARLMAQECWRRDVQLTFNHQLRFSEPVRRATELIEDGAIGEVERVEMARDDLYESGTHQVDLCNHFAGDVPGEWVIGQLDYRETERRYGIDITDQGLGLWRYENGVHGLASTGQGADAVGSLNRVIGTEGVVEVDWGELRVERDGDTEVEECSLGDPLPAAVEHVVGCLGDGTEPLLGARNALTATELVFGIYESSRRRGRVDLPLAIDDNPIRAMVDDGELDPA